MNPDTRPGYRLVPRNSPAHGPDLQRYLNEAPDLCKSGLAKVVPKCCVGPLLMASAKPLTVAVGNPILGAAPDHVHGYHL
jgi:hypothetical protein